MLPKARLKSIVSEIFSGARASRPTCVPHATRPLSDSMDLISPDERGFESLV